MSRRAFALLIAAALAALPACTPERIPPSTPPAGARSTEPAITQEVSDKAPAGSIVKTATGTVDLATLWADHVVVLVFYMGHWCPHCQKQLADLEAHKAQFDNLGATLVAVSTDTPDDAAALVAKLGLHFDVYSDPELQTIAKWGVADYGTNIAKPATFIVVEGGRIMYRRVGANEADRPPVSELTQALADRMMPAAGSAAPAPSAQ